MAYKGIGESVAALKKVTGTDLDHLKATPISLEEFKAKQAANQHLVTPVFKPKSPQWIQPGSYKSSKPQMFILPKKEAPPKEHIGDWERAMPPEGTAVDYILDGITTKLGVSTPPKLVHECHPGLMDRVSMATNDNVQLQNRSMHYGSSFDYRLYCDRCKQTQVLLTTQVNHVEDPDDAIVAFCMAHQHNGKANNALKVLSAFANVSYSEAGSLEPKATRKFRDDGDE